MSAKNKAWTTNQFYGGGNDENQLPNSLGLETGKIFRLTGRAHQCLEKPKETILLKIHLDLTLHTGILMDLCLKCTDSRSTLLMIMSAKQQLLYRMTSWTLMNMNQMTRQIAPESMLTIALVISLSL